MNVTPLSEKDMPAEGLEPPTNGLQIDVGGDAQDFEIVKINCNPLF
jgi:hypothetical protein